MEHNDLFRELAKASSDKSYFRYILFSTNEQLLQETLKKGMALESDGYIRILQSKANSNQCDLEGVLTMKGLKEKKKLQD